MTLALPGAGDATRDRALAVLLGAPLEPVVDLVAWSPAPDRYEVASAEGHLRFWRHRDVTPGSGTWWAYESEVLSGLRPGPAAGPDPLRQPRGGAGGAAPHPARNSYPHALDHLAQLFDHRSAPDLVVLHTASHYWGDHGRPPR